MVATPSIFRDIMANQAHIDASEVLDIEIVCDRAELAATDEEDFFGYDTTGAYSRLYAITRDGTGGGYHLWDPSPVDASYAGVGPEEWPVVLIGSEGDRAKVARNVKEFVQTFLTLAPYHRDVVGQLPGLNTLPNNGDIDGVTEHQFDVAGCVKLVSGWKDSGDTDPEYDDAVEVLLQVVGTDRMEVKGAIETILAAHLAQPRFAIKNSDD